MSINETARAMFEYIEFLVLADAIDPHKTKFDASLIPPEEALDRWEADVRAFVLGGDEHLASFDKLRDRVRKKTPPPGVSRAAGPSLGRKQHRVRN